MATQSLTSGAWRTVRIFISSTFRDMHAERNHLVRFVFPKRRQELMPRRIHLVDVDLRWGVTSEQDAHSVCREVVDECRPRFLYMLDGRPAVGRLALRAAAQRPDPQDQPQYRVVGQVRRSEQRERPQDSPRTASVVHAASNQAPEKP